MSRKLVKEMNVLIADLTVFYQKLRHYHWNVKGPQFFQLHEKFEIVYDEVGMVIDELAERVVGLDGVPHHTLKTMLEVSTLKEDEEMATPGEMVNRTMADIVTINEKFQKAIEIAEEDVDRTSANLLDGAKDGLEAHQWMLKAWAE